MLVFSFRASSILAVVSTRTPSSSLISAPNVRTITHALKINGNIFVADVTECFLWWKRLIPSDTSTVQSFNVAKRPVFNTHALIKVSTTKPCCGEIGQDSSHVSGKSSNMLPDIVVPFTTFSFPKGHFFCDVLWTFTLEWIQSKHTKYVVLSGTSAPNKPNLSVFCNPRKKGVSDSFFTL